MGLGRVWDVATATAASVARPDFGNTHCNGRARPEEPLELYEFEVCPYCRIVREAMSALSLDPIVYPCPRGGRRFRTKVLAEGGKSQFPFLIDPNTGMRMYESADIVRYLFVRYGEGRAPWFVRSRGFAVTTSMLASSFRPTKGRRYVPARAPERPLELYGYEGSPFCRLAREALCELEIPYHLHNVPRNSPEREGFVSLSGKMQVPYLVDPNTGASMFESGDIVRYLYETYAL